MLITPIIWFCIIGASTAIVVMPYIISEWIENKRRAERGKWEYPQIKSFVVSEYLDRMEKTNLEILEAQKPIDKAIILWWGLDGLRLNEDGSLEWISRRKTNPSNKNESYQQCRSANVTAPLDMCQTPQEAITAMRMQMAQQAQNAALIAAMQNHVAPHPGYLYGWNWGSGVHGSFAYTRQLTDCCCYRDMTGRLIF